MVRTNFVNRLTRTTKRRAMALAHGVLLFAGLAMAAATSARAQTPPEGTVSANGTAAVERKPDLIRMQVDLSAEGKDIKEALANLKALEKADKDKLAKLGVNEASVHFSDAAPGATNDQRQQQMEQMIRARSGRGKAPTTGPAHPSVSVSTTLKAEWPVKSETGEDMLVDSNELQGKVKDAGLTGASVKPNRTPEEEEAAEEAAAMMNQNGEANAHEPVFVFVGKVSKEDRAKATADAFKNAKAEAGRLAGAAGAELGGLRQLTSTSGADAAGGNVDSSNPYQRYYYQQMQMQALRGEAPADDEAVGAQPGKVSYRVTVSATFALK